MASGLGQMQDFGAAFLDAPQEVGNPTFPILTLMIEGQAS